MGISQMSISRNPPLIVDAINKLATQCIMFPYTAEEQVSVKGGYNSIAGLPNTIGAIACTLMRVKAPRQIHSHTSTAISITP